MEAIRRRRRRHVDGEIVTRSIPSRLKVSFQRLIDSLVSSGVRRGPNLQQRLVDIARPANSEFHCMFEWNNTVAAEKFRLEQARQYVKSVSIVINVNNEIGFVTIKANSSVKMPENISREYFTLNEASDRADIRQALIRQIRSDMMAFIQKYANHRRHFGARLQIIIDEMGRLIQEIR